MKKLLKILSNWWNYAVCKKDHIEKEVCYGKDYNKLGKIYYFTDVYNVSYHGNKEISRQRVSRIFIKKQEYINKMYGNASN